MDAIQAARLLIDIHGRDALGEVVLQLVDARLSEDVRREVKVVGGAGRRGERRTLCSG